MTGPAQAAGRPGDGLSRQRGALPVGAARSRRVRPRSAVPWPAAAREQGLRTARRNTDHNNGQGNPTQALAESDARATATLPACTRVTGREPLPRRRPRARPPHRPGDTDHNGGQGNPTQALAESDARATATLPACTRVTGREPLPRRRPRARPPHRPAERRPQRRAGRPTQGFCA
ncbi:hypothetical protein GCM10010287_31420 [Streptomyces variabilis]|uniref:Uncharacterized protein n=1 Tax=Streptomyces variabilis TaxID=67372 RepID=A0ABQ2TZP7_9ACTN|nr:hypothetical protein GCM10010265_09230 [Streptomyces griseoincarnatus]GGT55181.1 hypothetical protein GCM10010287_31420 [Streptomyces variabilis]